MAPGGQVSDGRDLGETVSRRGLMPWTSANYSHTSSGVKSGWSWKRTEEAWRSWPSVRGGVRGGWLLARPAQCASLTVAVSDSTVEVKLPANAVSQGSQFPAKLPWLDN